MDVIFDESATEFCKNGTDPGPRAATAENNLILDLYQTYEEEIYFECEPDLEYDAQ